MELSQVLHRYAYRAAMNIKSFTRYSVVLLGMEYLAFGAVALFILARPALASVMSTPAPTQEILAAPVIVPKPSATPTPVVIVPPTETPVAVTQPVQDDPVIPTDIPEEEPQVDDGSWIEVDLSEQRTYVYENNVLLTSFLVSTGVWDTPTVTGEYNIYVKVPLQDMSGPGYYLTDVPWVMFFYDEYGFHGTYWHNNFGTPMSRGCVNLTIDDARWLYDWASVGTRVVIHE